jgi:hypothetical protein
MTDRRPLTEGLKPPTPPIDPLLEKQFVFGGKPKPELVATPPPLGRASLTTRIRADFATALKRASLERQLHGVTPHTVQEMLEQAQEPWLKAHGYLP